MSESDVLAPPPETPALLPAEPEPEPEPQDDEEVAAIVPAASADAGASSASASAPKPPAALIEEVLSGVPQTAEDLYKKLAAKAEAGGYAAPTLKAVQSLLSSRGEQFALKRKIRNRTKWVRLPPGSARKSPLSGGGGSASKSASKKKAITAKKKAELVKKEKAAANSRAAMSKVDELLSRPLSAFLLFGFSQRGVLKKQRTATSIKEAVKAIGERWLLLGDAERAKYEAMALEDDKRAEAAAAARAQAAEAAEALALEAARMEEEAAAAAAAEGGGEDDGDEEDGEEAAEAEEGDAEMEEQEGDAADDGEADDAEEADAAAPPDGGEDVEAMQE